VTATVRRRVLIIANRAAGRLGRGRHRLDAIVRALEGRGCAVVVRYAGPVVGDAERLAREAEADFEIIAAAGGDGTLNAVANGLAASAPRPIALLPFGTANVLACDIGLPRRAESLAELIVAGSAQPIWPGRVGDRLFLTMASSGFDAQTVAAVDPWLKRRFGRFAFAWAILVCLTRYRPHELTVRVDGTDYRAAGAIATKGRCYAGPFVIAPEADLAKPVLDLLLLRRAGRWAVLRYLAVLLLGRASRCKDVQWLRTRAASLTAAAPVPVQADGETFGNLPITLGIAERPLSLIRP
jgi:diacylglycerol kinase (ATP)